MKHRTLKRGKSKSKSKGRCKCERFTKKNCNHKQYKKTRTKRKIIKGG